MSILVLPLKITEAAGELIISIFDNNLVSLLLKYFFFHLKLGFVIFCEQTMLKLAMANSYWHGSDLKTNLGNKINVNLPE